MWSTPRSGATNMSPTDIENSPVEGISHAIKRAMLLQDKLRKAISRTAPVNCSADRSLASLNREREALLLVRYIRMHYVEIRLFELTDECDRFLCFAGTIWRSLRTSWETSGAWNPETWRIRCVFDMRSDAHTSNAPMLRWQSGSCACRWQCLRSTVHFSHMYWRSRQLDFGIKIEQVSSCCRMGACTTWTLTDGIC